MVVLCKVEDVYAWWDRIATYWLRKSDKKRGSLLAFAKLHAQIQGVRLPPQPPWPRNFHTEDALSAYLQAVKETMMRRKESVHMPPLIKYKETDPRKRPPPSHGDPQPHRKKSKSDGGTRNQPPHDDLTWS